MKIKFKLETDRLAHVVVICTTIVIIVVIIAQSL